MRASCFINIEIQSVPVSFFILPTLTREKTALSFSSEQLYQNNFVLMYFYGNTRGNAFLQHELLFEVYIKDEISYVAKIHELSSYLNMLKTLLRLP